GGAQLEKTQQQPVQDHGIGHIRDVKLVEADQTVAPGNAPRNFIERIGHTAHFTQLVMHATHKFVKVQARLALDWHGLIEGVHQEAFATPYTAPHVYAAGHLGTAEQLSKARRAHLLERHPVVVVLLQAIDRRLLCGINLVAPLVQRVKVILAYCHKNPDRWKKGG